MTGSQRSTPHWVGSWLRCAFSDAVAAEFPPAIVHLLDTLEAGAAAGSTGMVPEDSLSDRDFRRELEAAIPHLRAYGRSVARNANTADDLVQETLVRAWEARARFELGTNMRAWIFTICRNLFYSQMRRARFKGDWNDHAADAILCTAPAQHGVMDLADLYRALDHIPSTQRDAILLIGAGGLAYEEAAAILDCATGTIKSRVSRGRAALAVVMAEGMMPARRGHTAPLSATDRIMADVRALEMTHAANVAGPTCQQRGYSS